MDEPTRAKARTIYHSAELVEATAAVPVQRGQLELLNQLTRILPDDVQDECWLALIHNVIELGRGE